MNKFKCRFGYGSFFLLLMLNSCATVKIEKPVEAYDYVPVRPTPSIIGFTLEAKLSDIQKELNETYTGLVYEDNSLDDNGGDNLMVKAWKQENIVLTMKEDMLIYRVPLKLWIKAGFKTKQFGITLSDYREVSGAIALVFRTRLSINPDWTINTHTETSGYEWITEPVVKVAGLNIPVRFVADLILQKNLKTISSSIDESVKEYLDLKPYALQAWKSLNQPLSLSNEYKLWLNPEVSDFYISPIVATNGTIRLHTGVKSVLETSVGVKPSAKAPAPLPQLQIKNDLKDELIINASLDIPFDEINQQATNYIGGQIFSQGGRSVKVETINIYGSNGKLIAETRLSGSFKGIVYFKGIPTFNTKDSTLYLRDFEFDLSTRNVLIKSATWLNQGGFRNMMAKKLVWSLAPEIKMLVGEINRSLKSYPLAAGITMQGQVNRISIDDILITPDGVKPFVSAEGKMSVVFSPFGARN
jgi:hypothetical protein